MQVRQNKAKQTLLAGGTIYSSSVRLPEPGLCELLGYAGFDFVLLDGEHGALDASSIDRMVQGCYAGGTVPVVRTLRPRDPEAVMLSLDLGAQGILIPHCRSADDARTLRSAAFYPTSGTRGFGPGRGAGWGAIPIDEYLRAANEQLLLLALIEDPEALDHIDEIAASGLDVLWVGTGDLAMAFGVPGERSHPRVLEAADCILKACRKHNVAAGYPAGNADEANRLREQGYRVIGYACAENYVMQMSRQFLGKVGR
jgi:staphyloferrin B biosynthesis citrate synthase